MNFLPKIIQWCNRTFKKSGTVCGFIYSKHHYKLAKNEVYFAAFMPRGDEPLSVFRIDGLTESEIWKIGQKIRQARCRARGDILPTEIIQVGLNIDFDDKPPRHASISGWPNEEEARRLVAIELASKARLRIKPQ